MHCSANCKVLEALNYSMATETLKLHVRQGKPCIRPIQIPQDDDNHVTCKKCKMQNPSEGVSFTRSKTPCGSVFASHVWLWQ